MTQLAQAAGIASGVHVTLGAAMRALAWRQTAAQKAAHPASLICVPLFSLVLTASRCDSRSFRNRPSARPWASNWKSGDSSSASTAATAVGVASG